MDQTKALNKRERDRDRDRDFILVSAFCGVRVACYATSPLPEQERILSFALQ
jgi:hypothetical protein